MTTVAPPQAPAELSRTERRRLSEATRAERRFGWLLCAPAVIVMLAVSAYPIVYAIYLSLQRYDLRFPEQTHFVGLSDYGTVLSSGTWWHAFFVTVIIMVVSVAIELALGMALALLLYYTPLWRGLVRTSILLPYGIVTVAAAYSWQFAWTPGVGYLDRKSTRLNSSHVEISYAVFCLKKKKKNKKCITFKKKKKTQMYTTL